jgi:hypothetical protein
MESQAADAASARAAINAFEHSISLDSRHVRKLGEDVTTTLELVPRQRKVIERPWQRTDAARATCRGECAAQSGGLKRIPALSDRDRSRVPDR